MAVLVVAAFGLYREVANHAFLTFDDDRYVAQNPVVQQGLSWAGVAWAFTTTSVSNWHPLTWLSHMVDCQLFGVEPGPHHVVNIAWHAGVCVLVFFTWKRLTGDFWPSAWTAALLAVHPVHVESVAWLAERKDLLCAFFWWLGVFAYVDYARRPSVARYAAVLLAFAASLLAKPMAVTFPAALLLLDAWPLARSSGGGAPAWRNLVVEKIPFFALSAISSVITVQAQQAGGALADLNLSIPARLANAATAYVDYLVAAAWPANLAPLYPLEEPSVAGVSIALAALAGISFAAWRWRAENPYLWIGWLWYLGTLLPVIGIIQVGSQARADRYMYIPLVGIYVATAWGLAAIIRRADLPRAAVASAAAITLLALGYRTHAQVPLWSDTVTLFEHSLELSGPNAVAHGLLGREWAVRRDWPRAAEHYRAAIELRPELAQARNNLGTILIRQGDYAGAVEQLIASLSVRPDNYRSLTNLGLAYYRLGQLQKAELVLRESLTLSPNTSETHSILADVLDRQGRTTEAARERAISKGLAPDSSRVRPPSESRSQ